MSIDLGIHHLRAVVAVADAGGFTAAARSLGLAQSSLSRTVSEAERRLRVRLFTRTTRTVAPTAEGADVVRLARRLVADYDAGLAHLVGYTEGSRGAVSVAALPSLAAVFLPPILSRYSRDHPQVTVRVQDALADEVLRQLRAGEVDVAVTVAGTAPRGLAVRPVAADAFFLAVAASHPLAERDAVGWAELDGLPFIAFGETSSIRQPVARALAAAGAETGPVLEAQNVAAVAGLAAAGLGVTALPGFVLPLVDFAGLRHVPLVPQVRRTVALLRVPHRPLSRATADLVRDVEDAAGRADPLPHGTRWLDA